MAEHSKGDKMDGDSMEDDVDAKGLLWRKKGSPTPPSIPQVIVPYSIESMDYYMKYKQRGKCVIINQKDFQMHTKLKERRGTDKDASSLYRCFRALDFSVEMKHNLEIHQISKFLEAVSKEDHSNSDCFVCCFLSHGDEGVLYGTDGKFPTDNLFEQFTGDKCPSLAGKPKIFFIQACQGDKLDRGTNVMICRESADSAPIAKIPNRADFLIVYSTVPGYYSWRNTTEGSWFVQALCAILENHSKTDDLLSMMTMVNHTVAYRFESCCPGDKEMDMMKQVPCVTSTLTRKVYFSTKL